MDRWSQQHFAYLSTFFFSNLATVWSRMNVAPFQWSLHLPAPISFTRQRSAAKHHRKAEIPLFPFRRSKSPHPSNTVRQNSTSRQKTSIFLPTTLIAHSAAKQHLKEQNTLSAIRPPKSLHWAHLNHNLCWTCNESLVMEQRLTVGNDDHHREGLGGSQRGLGL